MSHETLAPHLHCSSPQLLYLFSFQLLAHIFHKPCFQKSPQLLCFLFSTLHKDIGDGTTRLRLQSRSVMTKSLANSNTINDANPSDATLTSPNFLPTANKPPAPRRIEPSLMNFYGTSGPRRAYLYSTTRAVPVRVEEVCPCIVFPQNPCYQPWHPWP